VRRRVAVAGTAVRLKSVMMANSLGIAYVPSDRKGQGLHLAQSLSFNLTLPGVRLLALFGIRRPGVDRRVADDLIQRFAVRGARLEGRVLHLSGGNQQKIAMAKWMPLKPRILLLNDPTARHRRRDETRSLSVPLRRLAAGGTGIILLSSDTPELVNLCGRVMVFADWRVRNVIPRERLSEEIIVSSSLGVLQPDAVAETHQSEAAQ